MDRSLPRHVQIVTTLPHRDQAMALADNLVTTRLAGCVQIVGPITSVYRWKDKVETAEEWQCWAKTRADLAPAVYEHIRGQHPYEVPEILTVPILDGDSHYLAWLDEQTAASSEHGGV